MNKVFENNIDFRRSYQPYRKMWVGTDEVTGEGIYKDERVVTVEKDWPGYKWAENSIRIDNVYDELNSRSTIIYGVDAYSAPEAEELEFIHPLENMGDIIDNVLDYVFENEVVKMSDGKCVGIGGWTSTFGINDVDKRGWHKYTRMKVFIALEWEQNILVSSAHWKDSYSIIIRKRDLNRDSLYFDYEALLGCWVLKVYSETGELLKVAQPDGVDFEALGKYLVKCTGYNGVKAAISETSEFMSEARDAMSQMVTGFMAEVESVVESHRRPRVCIKDDYKEPEEYVDEYYDAHGTW